MSWELAPTALVRVVLFLAIVWAVATCSSGCAPRAYPLAGHPGWTLQESAVPLTGLPDEPPVACGFQMPSQDKGPPQAPCGMTDATTDCSTKTVRLWWYARPGALDHELTHVEECNK